MDTETTVDQRIDLPSPPPTPHVAGAGSRQKNAIAGASTGATAAPPEAAAALSLDPLRHTDRYRLVMPYTARW